MTRRQQNNRLAEYEDKTSILATREVPNAIEVERNIIAKFNEEFTLVRGREYFVGDVNRMIQIVNYYADLQRNKYVSRTMGNPIYIPPIDPIPTITNPEPTTSESTITNPDPTITISINPEPVTTVPTIIQSNNTPSKPKRVYYNNAIYTCEICEASFDRISNFQNHIVSKNGCEIYLNKKFDCDKCDSRFTSKKSLIQHKKKVHNINENLIDITNKLKIELNNATQKIKELEKKPGRPKKKTTTQNNITNNTTIGKQKINQQIFIIQ